MSRTRRILLTTAGLYLAFLVLKWIATKPEEAAVTVGETASMLGHGLGGVVIFFTNLSGGGLAVVGLLALAAFMTRKK